MKLTKGMKKALSLLLSAAMVVTGVNVTTNTASASGNESDGFTIVATGGTKDVTVNGETDVESYVNVWVKDDKSTGIQLLDGIKSVAKDYKKPVVEVSITDNAKVHTWSFGPNWGSYDSQGDYNNKEFGDGDKIDLTNLAKDLGDDFESTAAALEIDVPEGAVVTLKVYNDNALEVSEVPSEKPSNTPVNEKTNAPTASAATSGSSVTSGSTVTSAPAVSETPAATAPATAAPTKAPATEKPAKTEKPDEENQAFLMFNSQNDKFQNWNTKVRGGNGQDATITGNGRYTVSIDKKDYTTDAQKALVDADGEGAKVFGVDIMGICNTQKFDASKIAFSDVVVKCDGKEIKTDISKMYEGDIEGKGNYRLEIRNEWGYGDGEFATKDEFDGMNPDFKVTESLSVTFTIKGIKEGKTPEGAFKTADDKSVVAVGGERAKAADAADVVKTAAPSTKPAVTTTKPAVTTKPAITTAAAVKGTSKLTVAKKLVVVAPNKSVKVAFKAKKAKNTSGAAVVKATSKSKKVATVKVKGKNVIIKAPKKAVKGASTTVTLKSTKANGKAISAKIKVYVRNSAKKVKAAKKSITVKKGKTTKLVVKASKVQNKKKAFADTITVKGKVLKLTAVKYAKGKATLTLKGAKKAKKKVVKIKVGKKTVKVKATVK